jgi:hypothetical protein
MGLFDYVRVDVPLPDGKPGKHFQTKDFDDPYLEQYVITSDGRLIHERVRYDIDPPDKAAGPTDCQFHGYLNFYDYSDTHEWREFNAKFTDGRLIEIVEVKAQGIEAREGGDAVAAPSQDESPVGNADAPKE